jgi:hypothetical protein
LLGCFVGTALGACGADLLGCFALLAACLLRLGA